MNQTQTRAVTAMYSTHTRRVLDVPGLKKSITMLKNHRPSFANKPLLVRIEYERPRHITATLLNAGYRPCFEKLKGQLQTELGDAVMITGGPGRTASFEVYADGSLVHSKLGGSVGKIDTDGVPIWTDAECLALVAKLKPLLRE